MRITHIDDAFENIFDYYRTDQDIRSMFKEENLIIAVKFGDTKREYSVIIHQDQEILLERHPSINKPNIRIRIKSEQLLLDLVNEEYPVADAFKSMKIRISKGIMKVLKIVRKSSNFLRGVEFKGS